MIYYRAFYLPKNGSWIEKFQDNEKLEELPSGALLVIEIDTETGARQIMSEKKNLTKKEQYFFDYASRQLEPKHDGGGTEEHAGFLRENKHLRGF
jgi:hypothetical protein